MSGPYFHVPLNLPHAATVAGRIVSLLDSDSPTPANATILVIARRLSPFLGADDPPDSVAYPIRDEVAELARRLVREIEAFEIGNDRLGQRVRNLFECLELGQEGAVMSLRAGEDPKSLQRPT